VSTPSRHADFQQRLARFNGMSAMAITLLVVLSQWGRWPIMGVIVVINVFVIAGNMAVTFWLLPRMSHRDAEIIRGVINVGSNIAIAHLAGWPLPVWLWLPYVAAVNDHLAPRTALAMCLVTCGANTAAALVDGVGWQLPLGFTLLSFFLLEISRLRFGGIRAMLQQSDRDRDALARLHASLTEQIAARELAEVQLRQAQKLEAVGRLAAGMAHEINTPVQFVSDSVEYLRSATGSLLQLVDAQRSLLQGAANGDVEALAERAAEAEAEVDLAFLRDDVVGACDHALDGTARVADIVRSIKQFAHPEQSEQVDADLNAGIQSTVVLAGGEVRGCAEVRLDLAELPLVRCHPGEVNQVILNLIVNAAHAIEDAGSARGVIGVTSRAEAGEVIVEVSDNGAGIAAEIQHRIFEPFFTTKAVGRGTGQGLAVARAVVEKHGGRLSFESARGKGTTFRLSLPRATDGQARAA
jgi:signal transduction histidine kinase